MFQHKTHKPNSHEILLLCQFDSTAKFLLFQLLPFSSGLVIWLPQYQFLFFLPTIKLVS